MDSAETEEKKAAQALALAQEEQLPRELIEEILSRVPPKSLVRLRVVCKRWKSILDDKRFINNHKETFRFILTTKSKVYSVSIDPKIVVRELLTLDTPGLESENPKDVINGGEFLICVMDEGAAVWNPWLKQSVWINHRPGVFLGMFYNRKSDEVRLYEPLWSSACEDAKFKYGIGSVSLNGSLFWLAYRDKKDPLYSLVNVSFSKKVSRFCYLPCRMGHPRDAFVLEVFKGDRFSFFKQCHVTKKIEIWVTKDKVNVEDGDDVVWVSFMTFSIPNFPSLVLAEPYSDQQPSYYIDDTRLVVCSCDQNGKAWIYVLGEDKLISKVKLDYVVGSWTYHCTYFPTLVPVPVPLGE